MSWAQNPYIRRVNVAICLIAERLSEVSQRLVQNPHVATIEIPLPDAALRQSYLKKQLGEQAALPEGMTLDGLTQLSGGLNLVNLSVALSRSGDGGRRLDLPRFRKLKKAMIERQCRDLVTFIEPKHDLEMVVGHEAAKERLRLDAKWIGEGRLDAAPMGYLVCGPVGTGKTFMAECYAGAIGIPCLVLRNFRSKFVGETEGNLEQVLTVLRSLGPVVVIVDEADAALGNRSMEGDSGTSNRVFSMIASQMGDTKYRGRIVWMLLTSRPDMLPIDLKRQGRAEVHIPLFYPQEAAEIGEMLRVMAAKNKVRLAEGALPEIKPERQLSGADLESIILGARRRALAAGRETVERGDVDASLGSFIPSAQGLEKEIQELVAVIECTDREFLTPKWREAIAAPDGRLKLQQRLATMRAMVD
jgi:SpoVK/Ycf46/Vps4 family AAA+-type ATPase